MYRDAAAECYVTRYWLRAQGSTTTCKRGWQVPHAFNLYWRAAAAASRPGGGNEVGVAGRPWRHWLRHRLLGMLGILLTEPGTHLGPAVGRKQVPLFGGEPVAARSFLRFGDGLN